MGKKAIHKALDVEATSVAQAVIAAAVTQGILRVDRAIVTGFIYGLEVGGQVAITDIVAARRMLEHIDLGDADAPKASASRLLAALSK